MQVRRHRKFAIHMSALVADTITSNISRLQMQSCSAIKLFSRSNRSGQREYAGNPLSARNPLRQHWQISNCWHYPGSIYQLLLCRLCRRAYSTWRNTGSKMADGSVFGKLLRLLFSKYRERPFRDHQGPDLAVRRIGSPQGGDCLRDRNQLNVAATGTTKINIIAAWECCVIDIFQCSEYLRCVRSL